MFSLSCALAVALVAPPLVAPPASVAPLPSVAVETHVLSNGLTVLLSPDARLPIVAVEMRYLVGSADEEKGKSGFAHLFEHLMFQGSAHFDDEYFAPFEPIGAQVNGTTNTDRTNYYEQVPREYLELALWMEADRLQGLLPVMTLAKLDNQRDVVKNERRQRYENTPYGEFWKYATETVFPEGHPYHHTTIGSHEDLTAASLDDVKAFFERYYVPRNAVLTIVGDFEVDVALALATKYFGSLPPGQRAPRPAAVLPVLAASVHVSKTDDVNLPRVHLAWPSPAFFAEGDAALDVLATLLTDGKSSRLYQPLVYEQKVAKDVAAFQVSQALGSYFVVQATAAPGRTVEELSAALFQALEKALSSPPTDDELKRALNGWRKSFYEDMQGILSRAQRLSTYQHFVNQPDYLEADLARYTGLTTAKLHEEANRWLSAKRYVRIDIVPEPKAKPPKADPVGGAK